MNMSSGSRSTLTEISSSLAEYFQKEGYEKFQKFKFLTNEQTHHDPENDPYRSKYEARALLQDVLDRVHKEREENASNPCMRMLESALQYHLGVNYIQTEERPSGEECLEKCLQLLGEELCMKTEAVSIAVAAHSELGILWASRYQGADKALSNLQTAESLFKKFKHEVGSAPFDVNELLQTEDKQLTGVQRENKFEKIYTLVLFYLAQVHKNLENSGLSAKYCQQTLRRQIVAKEYDPMEWAVNSACLSQYYITQNDFVHAKHCLSCANVVMEEAKPPEGLGQPSPDEGEEVKKLRDAIPQRKADIARCWVKYCLALLEFSKESLYDDVCELDVCRQAAAIRELALSSEISGDLPKDHGRMPLEVDAVEEKVRHLPVTTLDEGRGVFLLGKKYVETALEYFVMDGYCTDNIELHQDLSSLYKHLVFFEKDPENKCKMHKRRIDLLLKVLGEINPKFYILICRQLQFELGEVYGNMLDLKVKIANASGQNPTAHAVKKINLLCQSSIRYFNEFLETLKNVKKVFPDKFDEDVEHPALIASFHLARLHSKILTTVKTDKLTYMQKSLSCYTWIANYVDRNPQCETSVQKEVEICREMMVLMPASIARITNAMED